MRNNKSVQEVDRSDVVEQSEEKACSKGHWRLVGAVGLILAATAILVNLHDIKRYIRISTM